MLAKHGDITLELECSFCWIPHAANHVADMFSKTGSQSVDFFCRGFSTLISFQVHIYNHFSMRISINI